MEKAALARLSLGTAGLNHCPGPAHLLALANELGLTPDQRAHTESLFKAMEIEAVSLAKQLIEHERDLDDFLQARPSRRKRSQQLLEAIASLRGTIRQAHLQTHLLQDEILDAEQIRRSDQLRGYAEAGARSAT